MEIFHLLGAKVYEGTNKSILVQLKGNVKGVVERPEATNQERLMGPGNSA